MKCKNNIAIRSNQFKKHCIATLSYTHYNHNIPKRIKQKGFKLLQILCQTLMKKTKTTQCQSQKHPQMTPIKNINPPELDQDLCKVQPSRDDIASPRKLLRIIPVKYSIKYGCPLAIAETL